MKKKEDVHDYCSAKEGAQILQQKLGRPIRPDYICKMAKRRKNAIRSVRLENIVLYNRFDIAGSSIAQRNAPPDQASA